MAESTGVDRSWQLLLEQDPGDVCRRAAVSYDGACYGLDSLGTGLLVCPSDRRIVEPGSTGLHRMVEHYFDHAALRYLIAARDIGETGRQIKPSDLKGGHHFFTQGTHQLPLPELAAKYGSDREGFLRKAAMFGGRPLEFGDASVELRPMPRIPVQVILWLGDDEFESRADLLFDSSAEFHCKLDVLWSIAMMSLSVLL